MDTSHVSVDHCKNSTSQLIAICFIQASSTTAYAVFYSGLSIYLTQNKFMSPESAALLTGLFLSLSYVLPLLGGFIVDRMISCKNLYYAGVISSVFGCGLLAKGDCLFLGLSCYLIGSLGNICLNIFITQLFSSEQKVERRVAFTWNYIGMNMGFMIGYLMTGFSTLSNNYYLLFLIISVLLLVSVLVTALFICEPALGKKREMITYSRFLKNLVFFITLISVIYTIFNYIEIINAYMTAFTLATMMIIMSSIYLKVRNDERRKYLDFVSFSLISILFWTFYLMTPIAMMQLINHSVDRTLFGITLAPQWFGMVNSIVILMIAPLLAMLSKKEFSSKLNSEKTFFYFTAAFLFLLSGFLILYAGFSSYIGQPKLPIHIIICYLVMLTLGEIAITPASNALVGELISEKYRGIMTGVMCMNMGVGSLFAGSLSSRYILPYVKNAGLGIQDVLKLQQMALNISLFLIIFIFLTFLVRNVCGRSLGMIKFRVTTKEA